MLSSTTSNKNFESKILPHKCRICQAPALYTYFNVISCDSCRIFFRRNAQRGQTSFTCDFDGQCEININNRHICKSCRLKKCFQCGMTIDKIRGPLKQNRSKRNTLAKLPTLNLLESDQSLLTINQWTLLSNICNCYKESQILPYIQRLITPQNIIPFTYSMCETLVDEFLVSIYETSGAYLCSNDDLRHLSPDDRSIILRNAANNVTCIGGAFIMQNFQLYTIDGFLTAMNTKYGQQTMDIHIAARKYIDSDIVLVKLAISLFAFSENTGCYFYTKTSDDLTNPLNIVTVQHKYAELTWKYLLYRYDYNQAVKRFLNVTLWLSSMNVLAVHAQTLAAHLNDVGSVIEKTEITLILDDVEEITGTNQ